jgi:anaerobic selenocysteine-containing dehydrogenase
MVQREVDPLTGAAREDVLIAREDADRLGLIEGDWIRLVSGVGSYTGRARIAEIKAGNLEVHWPEGNVLLSREEKDAVSREPDYNAYVRVEPST